MHILKLKITNYCKWQRRWYVESKYFMGTAKFDQFCDKGYTPYCPGDVCPTLKANGQHLERAPEQQDENGVLRNHVWYICSDGGNQEPQYFHSLKDLEISDFPNAMASKYADALFVHQQTTGQLDDAPVDEVIVKFAQDAWYDIFGFRHEEYLRPDSRIPTDRKHFLDIIRSWGRSPGHVQTSTQASKEEMTAIARITGANIPLTPAAAAGGRADLGGYYPHQAHTDKGAGRSTPYPHSSSSGSSWWASPNWGSWSWSSWSGRNWWS